MFSSDNKVNYDTLSKLKQLYPVSLIYSIFKNRALHLSYEPAIINNEPKKDSTCSTVTWLINMVRLVHD
jgi:hypothetical protein